MIEESEQPDTRVTEPRQLSAEVIERVVSALDAEDPLAIRQAFLSLRIEDQAELLNELSSTKSEQLLSRLGADLDPDLLPYLDEAAAERVRAHLGPRRTADLIAEMELDDALHIIEDLEPEEQQEILASIDPATRKELEAGLSYPEESAGRLMRRSMVFVPEFWTVGDTIDYLRRHAHLPDDFYVVYIVNPRFKPVGFLSLSRIMQSPRATPLREKMLTDLHCFTTQIDQEEVANAFRKYGLVEAPVVGEDGRLLGTITVDDVVEVMREEAEEDFLRLGGLTVRGVASGVFGSVAKRFPWLFVNLITALLASAVIGAFEEVIEKLVVLAVLMPIIASMGGNAGIQASTVTVRAIATGKRRRSVSGSIAREVIIGGLNGLGIGITMAAGIYLFYGSGWIAAVFAIACVVNMMVAGFAGAGLPLLMNRLKIDPAITSGVFLTMVTDIVGFLTFLGLATLVLFTS